MKYFRFITNVIFFIIIKFRSQKNKSLQRDESSIPPGPNSEKLMENDEKKLKNDFQQFEEGKVNLVHFNADKSSNNILHSVQKMLKSNSNSYITISGSHDQGNARFEELNRGKQCTAMAVSSLAMLFVKLPKYWDQTTVDSVLGIGNNLYSRSRKSRVPPPKSEPNPDFLTMNEVEHVITINTNKLKLIKLQDTLGCVNSNYDGLLPTLEEALGKALESSNFAVVICNSQSVAVAKRDNKFCMFDSHCRNNVGLKESNGAACLTLYDELGALIAILKHNLLVKDQNGHVLDAWFDLTSVDFKVLDPPSTTCEIKKKPRFVTVETMR